MVRAVWFKLCICVVWEQEILQPTAWESTVADPGNIRPDLSASECQGLLGPGVLFQTLPVSISQGWFLFYMRRGYFWTGALGLVPLPLLFSVPRNQAGHWRVWIASLQAGGLYPPLPVSVESTKLCNVVGRRLSLGRGTLFWNTFPFVLSPDFCLCGGDPWSIHDFRE